jgi:hypothetical protein
MRPTAPFTALVGDWSDSSGVVVSGFVLVAAEVSFRSPTLICTELGVAVCCVGDVAEFWVWCVHQISEPLESTSCWERASRARCIVAVVLREDGVPEK